MGLLFDLIADNALEKLDDYYKECHICNKKNLDLYEYHGEHHLENGKIDDDIYAVCSNCILTANLTHICDFEYIKTIEQYINNSNLTTKEKELVKDSLIEKYQRTPNIPSFIQYEDRPLCCNDITEFIGYPLNLEQLYIITEETIYWEKQIKKKSKSYDFRKYGPPESFRDVTSFKCKHCEKKYFTFQFS